MTTSQEISLLEEKIIRLETYAANQEKNIEELNQELIIQGKILQKLQQQTKMILTSLLSDSPLKPLSEETKPPHY
jgi:SlyX protein